MCILYILPFLQKLLQIGENLENISIWYIWHMLDVNQNLFVMRTANVLYFVTIFAHHCYIESWRTNKLYIFINMFVYGVMCSIYML